MGLGSSPNDRRGDVRAFVSLAQEALLEELFEQLLAHRNRHVPQATRLRTRQLQPWHLGIFTANTGDDGIKLRCIGAVLKILSIGHEGSLVMCRPSLQVFMVSTMRNRALPCIMRAYAPDACSRGTVSIIGRILARTLKARVSSLSMGVPVSAP
jgi:hypothetical protein